MGCWSEGAVVWRGKRGEVILREVEATKVPSSPAQVSGRRMRSRRDRGNSSHRGQKAEEKRFRWRLSGFELRRNEGFGGGAQGLLASMTVRSRQRLTRVALKRRLQHVSRLLDAWVIRKSPARLA
ncbi:unnamed protein product [Brassica rapa]|uniref:Uncharacterized protein n=1 Tax=Brassica campestris TaxID=3711 RepID=A0A3P6CQ62_BRACM|nr:unnamed protein product [Brassica rapa]VDD12565.1 unnamed protein product [Brassica rapa]